MKVGIFQILPCQGVFWAKLTPEGGVESRAGGGGYVTSSFPDGIVLFETDFPQDNEDIFKMIKEKVNFSSPIEVGISPIGNVYFRVNAENLEASIINYEMYSSEDKNVIKEFSLHLTPLFIEDEEAVFSAKFSVQTDEETLDKKKLLDHTFGVKFSKTLLIGFPTNDEWGRGIVYWLAFSIEN